MSSSQKSSLTRRKREALHPSPWEEGWSTKNLPRSLVPCRLVTPQAPKTGTKKALRTNPLNHRAAPGGDGMDRGIPETSSAAIRTSCRKTPPRMSEDLLSVNSDAALSEAPSRLAYPPSTSTATRRPPSGSAPPTTNSSTKEAGIAGRLQEQLGDPLRTAPPPPPNRSPGGSWRHSDGRWHPRNLYPEEREASPGRGSRHHYR